MDRFIFANAYDHLSADATANDPSSDLPLRVAFVATMPSRTDEFAADLDEVSATNYARFVVNGGRYTGNPVSGGIEVTGTSVTPIADVGDSGDPTTVAGWVLLRHTGSDATAYLIAASDGLPAEFQLLDGDDIAPEIVGALVDGTWERVTAEGGTAATVTYDDTGNAQLTGVDDVQAALDLTDTKLDYVADVLAGPVTDTATSLTALKTFLRIMAETATGGAVTLPTDKSLIGYDLDPADNPWVITIPDLTGETETIVYHVALLAQTGGNVAVSFASDGGAQPIVYSGPAPSEIPEEGLMLLTITVQAGALGKVYIDWASNIDGWGLTGHSATVTGGTHLFSHAFEHLTFTGTNPTLARDLRDCGGGSGMFWLLLTNSSGSSRTITWGPTMTWVAGGSLTSLANGASALVMLQTLDSGATAKAVNVTGLGGGTGDLLSTNNLSDLASASTARTNLGLGGAAVLSVGTTTGTVAAGDDSRITGAVPTSRTINGTDLSANRTFALSSWSAAAADLDLNSHKLINVTDPSSAQHAATKNYVDTTCFPRVIGLPMAQQPGGSNTWTFNAVSSIGGGYWATAVTNDQTMEWEIITDGGTWRVDMYYRSLTSGGIATFKIDGSSIGTIDTYAASATNANLGSITGATISASRHTLQVANATKNGSSINYGLAIQSITLKRTGP